MSNPFKSTKPPGPQNIQVRQQQQQLPDTRPTTPTTTERVLTYQIMQFRPSVTDQLLTGANTTRELHERLQMLYKMRQTD